MMAGKENKTEEVVPLKNYETSGEKLPSLNRFCRKNKVKKVEEQIRQFKSKEELKSVINRPAGVLGFTALHEATSVKAAEILRILLRNEADVNATANGGYTALHIAASLDAKDCIKVLLEHEPDLNIEDDYKRTPFCSAQANHNKKVSQLLKTAGYYLFYYFQHMYIHWYASFSSYYFERNNQYPI